MACITEPIKISQKRGLQMADETGLNMPGYPHILSGDRSVQMNI